MTGSIQLVPAEELGLSPRIGVAALTRRAFDGDDLNALWAELVAKLRADTTDVDTAMDLSVIAQLVGQQEMGLQLQAEALSVRAIYRSPCGTARPRLRVLALAAAADIGGNTPLEFLLEGAGIELYTYYVVPGAELPEALPDHDIAFVAVPESDEAHQTLNQIAAMTLGWPRPVVNMPRKVAELERDRLCKLLSGTPRVDIPATARVDRDDLQDLVDGEAPLTDLLPDGAYPLIVRPVGSQAGRGLARVATPEDLAAYLGESEADEFFISRFVDYSGSDGQFRKYRIAFIDHEPYACHMAIAEEWKLWYLNAGMGTDAGKRAEEARFFETFDRDFALRHAGALREIARRIDLDYFAIDCAETKAGELLIFEADIAMIVHNMDPAEIYPYKGPQMKKVFAAFQTMLESRAVTPGGDCAEAA